MRDAECGMRNEDDPTASAGGSGLDSAFRIPHPAFPQRGRLLGVDFGAVRVGLAVCDPDRRIASAADTYTRRTEALDAAAFAALATAEAAVGWVVGLAISLNGTEGPKAKECRAFGAWLERVTGLPVAYQDERFTTAAADDYLREARLSPAKRKAKRDRVAAQLILQSFLDASP
jgi:putative Holliday junction resolvase